MSDEVYGGNYETSPSKIDIDRMYDDGEIDHNQWIKLCKECGFRLTIVRDKKEDERNTTKQKELEN